MGLLSLSQWAKSWDCSERVCQDLRKHPHYPKDCEVWLAPRTLRFREQRLAEFEAALAAEASKAPEPEQLRAARQRKKAEQSADATS